jgi:hypothetical protein
MIGTLPTATTATRCGGFDGNRRRLAGGSLIHGSRRLHWTLRGNSHIVWMLRSTQTSQPSIRLGRCHGIAALELRQGDRTTVITNKAMQSCDRMICGATRADSKKTVQWDFGVESGRTTRESFLDSHFPYRTCTALRTTVAIIPTIIVELRCEEISNITL